MNDILWNAEELSAALGVMVGSIKPITGVSIDSRHVAPGDIFIALAGEHYDGHDFANDAAKKGAAAIIVNRRIPDLPQSCAQIVVGDTMRALVALGQYARRRFGGKIIGITGSVGKTGTKEALHFTLARQGKTHATIGNLNNHIGVPLSLARMPRDCQYAVIEMGMNHPGEIAPLSELCEPFVGIITAIAPAHIEFFANGLSGIADEKAQIVAGMSENSIAIFHRDTPHFSQLTKHAEARRVKTIIGFGDDATAQARLLQYTPTHQGGQVRADILGTVLDYAIGIPGRHVATNSLAVLAAIQSVGGDIIQAAKDLADLSPTAGRGLRKSIAIAGGSVDLIDDSYNASPESMRAAFAVLANTTPNAGGRRIAVLGDMLELGAHSVELHAGLADALLRAAPDAVFCCGKYMKHLCDAIAAHVPTMHAPDAAALAAKVKNALCVNDIVLIKGSYGSKMRLIIEALEKNAA